MVKVKLDKQNYEWLSEDIRDKISCIVDGGYSDDALLDCANDIAFIKSLYEEGVECKNDDEILELGKRLRKMVREYDKHSNIRPHTISGASEKEAVIFIYDF